MGNESVSESTEAVALRDEVRDIATNKENPRHVGYTRNEPSVMRYLDDRYKQVYGAGTVELGDGILAGPPSREEEDDAVAAYAETARATEQELREEWGADYDTNMTLVRETARELFPGSQGEALLERLAEGFFQAGGNDAQATKLLLQIAQRGNA